MKNILICGATGFIGKNLTLFFSKKKNYKVFAVYHKKRPFKCKNVKWIKCDLKNEKKVSKIVRNKHIVLQAAATTSGAQDIISRPYIHVTDNVVMNSYIFKACFEEKIQQVIFFSCTVMLQSSIKAQKENDFNLNNKIYPNYFGVAWTKISLEKQCEFFSRISNTKYTVIRHSNIYGPHDKFDLKKSHFFGATINKVMNSKEKNITIWGKGEESRDLLHVDDLCEFVRLALRNQSNNFEVFNCGYGKAYKVKDIVKKIIKISGKKLGLRHDLTKKSLNTYLSLNCSKAHNKIGWKKKILIDDGIIKTINWYLSSDKTR